MFFKVRFPYIFQNYNQNILAKNISFDTKGNFHAIDSYIKVNRTKTLEAVSAACKIMMYIDYAGVGPKQQQTLLPRRSRAIKYSTTAPFLRKETKETSPTTRARNQKEPANHDGTQSFS